MLRRLHGLALALAVCWSTPLAGQLPDWIKQVLIAVDLPVSADEARNEGVSNDEIRQVLGAMEAQKVPAHEARQVFDEERAARRDHGPVDNFGAFVQSRLQAGLRGQELAAAIRAEHAARGKGKGKADDKARGKDDGDERAKAKNRPGEDEKEPGAKPRKDDPPGKPEGKGKPTDQPARPNN